MKILLIIAVINTTSVAVKLKPEKIQAGDSNPSCVYSLSYIHFYHLFKQEPMSSNYIFPVSDWLNPHA